MKKRFLIIFLLFLIIFPLNFVEAREVKTLKDLFNNFKEIFITGRIASDDSDSYPDQVETGDDGRLPLIKDDLLTQEKDDLLTQEVVTCYFYNNALGSEQKCYDDSGRFGCSGLDSCSIDVYGNPGEYLKWSNSCDDGHSSTYIDGIDESLNFTCGVNNPPNIFDLSNGSNKPPSIIRFPIVPSVLYVNQTYGFSWTAYDPDHNGNNLNWKVNWGDGQPSLNTSCSVPYCFTYSASKIWSYPGEYALRVEVNDTYDIDGYEFDVRIRSPLNQTMNQTNRTDLSPPDISMSHFPLNPVVGGSVTLESIATDDVGLRFVDVIKGGSFIYRTCYFNSPYPQFGLCSYTLSNLDVGTYSYYGRALDSSGKMTVSPIKSFVVTYNNQTNASIVRSTISPPSFAFDEEQRTQEELEQITNLGEQPTEQKEQSEEGGFLARLFKELINIFDFS